MDATQGLKEVEDFASFYFDLLEHHRDKFRFHLSECAVLDWFGKTIKGNERICEFLKLQMDEIKHFFSHIEPCDEIGFRNTHVIECTKANRSEALATDSDEKHDVSQEKTPPNNTIACSSRKREKAEGNGSSSGDGSPMKRTRLAGNVVATPLDIARLSSTGRVEFHGKSMKKYQKETKWSRPCIFQAAYSKTPAGYLIHLVIYQGNMRCKRNLLKDFDAVQ